MRTSQNAVSTKFVGCTFSGHFVERGPTGCEKILRVPSWPRGKQVFLDTPEGAFVSVELRMLVFSVVLGIVAASHAASLQRGYKWTASSRDEKVEPLRGVAGRLDRALRNFLETFPLFAAVVLVAHVTDTHDALTEWGARLYFGGRLAYVLLCAAGVPLIRSLVWNVATIGILLIVAALLFG
jgi:uncharacterized MAPEG superfamily protein